MSPQFWGVDPFAHKLTYPQMISPSLASTPVSRYNFGQENLLPVLLREYGNGLEYRRAQLRIADGLRRGLGGLDRDTASEKLPGNFLW